MVFGALVTPIQSSPGDDQRTYKCDIPFTTKYTCHRTTEPKTYLTVLQILFHYVLMLFGGPNCQVASAQPDVVMSEFSV